jgi:predicted  nucleic acid-binding Zn-ribbon protein
MSMNGVQRLVFLMVGTLLAGCSCTGDPKVDGYACGRAGIDGGTYNQRVEQRQQTLEDNKDQTVQQQRELADLNAQQQSQQQDLDTISKQLAGLDQELDGLNRRANAAKSGNSANQTKLATLQRDIANVQTQTSVAKANTLSSDADRQAELDRLKKKYADLQKELVLITGGT